MYVYGILSGRVLACRQENVLRGITTLFESLIDMYDEQLISFISLASILIICICVITAMFITLFSLFVVYGIVRHVHTIKYKLVCCNMALSLPVSSVRAMYKHFKDIELNLKAMEGVYVGYLCIRAICVNFFV